MERSNMRSGVKKTAGKTQKNGNGAALKSGIVILMMIVAMVVYYYYLSNKDKEAEDTTVQISVAQELISRDLTANYPPTPKEVIRYYSDITKCFYNEEYTDEELEQLAIQTRMLYDDELVVNNDWAKYIIELREDINQFKENEIKITNYSVAASTDVDYFEDGDYEFARLRCSYYIANTGATDTIDEIYLLRKDEKGHWRIYGWDLAENVHVQENPDE